MITPKFITPNNAPSLLLQEDEYLKKIDKFNLGLFGFKDKDSLKKAYKICSIKWGDCEQNFITNHLNIFNTKMIELFPNQTKNLDISMISSNGRECGMPYTRKDFIVFTDMAMGSSHLLFHEMFHIISRQNENFRNFLYERIGFHDFGFDILEEHSIQFILNPDAPNNNYYTVINDFKVVPYADTMNVRKLKFLILDGNNKKLNDPNIHKEISSLYSKMFEPISYLLHPEEILAEVWSSFWHKQLEISDRFTIQLSKDHFLYQTMNQALASIPIIA